MALPGSGRGDGQALPAGKLVLAAPGLAAAVPVYFALVSPRPGAHFELLTLLQSQIVAPLVHRGLLSEFRVLTATPPSFVTETSTMLVFELVVPCPWPITDSDVQQWQQGLGAGIRLVVAPSQTPRQADSWDAKRARSVLARAMVLPPAKRVSPSKPPSWFSSCVDRNEPAEGTNLSSNCFADYPTLGAVDENTGQRFRVAAGATLLSAALAWELNQHLPASLRWRTSWRLAYAPRVHGVSLQTFYRRMLEEGPSLLLIQDHLGHFFGGFASSPWRVGDRYFGSGETFVFKGLRRLPKRILPLVPPASPAAGAGEVPAEAAEATESATRAVIQRAVDVLQGWHARVRAEAARGEREALAAGGITSPTEALDEVLGTSLAAPAAAAPGTGSPAAARRLVVRTESATAHDSRSESPRTFQGAAFPLSTAPSPPAQAGGGEGPARRGRDGEDGEEEQSEPAGGDVGVKVFHQSASKDQFFLFSDRECLAMGGGSAAALYIEKDLLHGMSNPCSTFGSEVLASSQNFIVGDLECWVFDDPSVALAIQVGLPEVPVA